MKAIGAGFPRTGTLSTKAALEHLGVGPCYHFVTQFEWPQDAEVWLAAARGHPVDWRALFADFGCAVDRPQSAFYKQLMDVYPAAKVLLNVRDPEQWYESIASTVYPASRSGLSAPAGMMHTAAQAIDALGWQGIFQGRFEKKEYALSLYEQWNQALQDYVPAAQLLVWEVKDGWEPLCRFVGVAVPDVPFSRLNDREACRTRAPSARVRHAVSSERGPVGRTLPVIVISPVMVRSWCPRRPVRRRSRSHGPSSRLSSCCPRRRAHR